MRMLRESSRGKWLVWSVLVSMALGCELGARKQPADDEARTTPRAKGSDDKLASAKVEAERAQIRTAAGATAPAPVEAAAPAPAAAKPPVAHYASRKRAVSDDPLDGFQAVDPFAGGNALKSASASYQAAKSSHGAAKASRSEAKASHEAARFARARPLAAVAAPPPAPVVRLDPSAAPPGR